MLGLEGTETFPIVRCRACGFVFAALLPSDECLRLLYEEVIDPELGLLESTRPGWLAQQLSSAVLLLEAIARVFPPTGCLKVLDLGCGYGGIVRALQGPGLRCTGLESSTRRREFLRQEGLPIVETVAEARQVGPYHAVVLNEVLEHVPEPRGLLSCCRELLVPDGLLLVSVPEFGEKRIGEIRSAVHKGASQSREVNPWEHLNYFDPSSLDSMLCRAGFRHLALTGSIDIGLRRGLTGLQKWGNAAKSMGRVLRSLLLGEAGGTRRIVQRTDLPGAGD